MSISSCPYFLHGTVHRLWKFLSLYSYVRETFLYNKDYSGCALKQLNFTANSPSYLCPVAGILQSVLLSRSLFKGNEPMYIQYVVPQLYTWYYYHYIDGFTVVLMCFSSVLYSTTCFLQVCVWFTLMSGILSCVVHPYPEEHYRNSECSVPLPKCCRYNRGAFYKVYSTYSYLQCLSFALIRFKPIYI